MSVRIRIRQQMSGTRGGQPWPPVGGILEVGDDEAEQLCRVTDSSPHPIAERVAEPEPEPKTPEPKTVAARNPANDPPVPKTAAARTTQAKGPASAK